MIPSFRHIFLNCPLLIPIDDNVFSSLILSLYDIVNEVTIIKLPAKLIIRVNPKPYRNKNIKRGIYFFTGSNSLK